MSSNRKLNGINPSVIVQLACKHEADTLLQEDWSTPVYCWRCVDKRYVVAVWSSCRVKCVTCKKYQRFTGFNARNRAEASAYKHGRKYPLHLVQCYERGKLLFVTTQAKSQGQLSLMTEEPPF